MRPLEDVRIISLEQYGAGPFGSMHLADLGASEGNLVLILAEVGKQPAADSADYVWYTAANAPEDHCAKLRKN